MKKFLFIVCLITSGLLIRNELSAQVRVNVNVNIGSQPVWGPVGYDYAQYYYFPDIDAYYDVPARQYVYLDGNRWAFAPTLPGRYNYDVYRGYKVVINEPRPYLHPDIYRKKYGKYKGWYGKQTIIRDSHDQKYYVVKGHPMYGKGNKDKYDNNDYNDRGNKGKYKGDKGNKGNKGHGNGKHGRD